MEEFVNAFLSIWPTLFQLAVISAATSFLDAACAQIAHLQFANSVIALITIPQEDTLQLPVFHAQYFALPVWMIRTVQAVLEEWAISVVIVFVQLQESILTYLLKHASPVEL